MIDDLDESLKRLLIRDLPVRNGEVDIAFAQPKREWSAKLSRPTLNLFLYDMRENAKLRQAHPMWETVRDENGHTVQRRAPVRVDLRYLITAWASEPEDEHRLLTRVLLALFANPIMPEEVLTEGLQDQPMPVQLMAAQGEDAVNLADVWSAMDNELRPAVVCVATVAMNPFQPFSLPLVRTKEVRMGQTAQPGTQRLEPRAGTSTAWTVGGQVRTSQPVEQLHLTVVERGAELPLQPEGRFTLGPVPAGNYTLEVSAEGRPARRYQITVPAADYVLDV